MTRPPEWEPDFWDLFGRPREAVDAQLLEALREDAPHGDITSAVLIRDDCMATGVLRAQSDCILAGLLLFERVFQLLDPDVRTEWHYRDGDALVAGSEVGRVQGRARCLLLGERTALNLLQRLSSIATYTRQFVEAVRGTGVVILDTRKTTPLWRWAEKYAVRVGGGRNHRQSLSDGVLVKDNHLSLLGGIKTLARDWEEFRRQWRTFMPEVEVTSLEQFRAALAAGVRHFLLDHWSPEDVAVAVREAPPGTWLEVSGGVRLDNVAAYARTGVHAISIGSLTYAPPPVDLHFKIALV